MIRFAEQGRGAGLLNEKFQPPGCRVLPIKEARLREKKNFHPSSVPNSSIPEALGAKPGIVQRTHSQIRAIWQPQLTIACYEQIERESGGNPAMTQGENANSTHIEPG